MYNSSRARFVRNKAKSETRQQYRPTGIKRYTAKLNLKGISFFTHPVYFAIIKKLSLSRNAKSIFVQCLHLCMVPLLCNLRCYLLFNAVVTKKTAKIFEGLRTYQRAFECIPRRPNFVIAKSFVRRSLEVFVLLCASASTETFKK